MGQIRVNGVLLKEALVEFETDDEEEQEKRKYIKIAPEVGVTACAVTNDTKVSSKFQSDSKFDNHFGEPNQYWRQNSSHPMARLKIYKRDPENPISMPFLGNNSDNFWGELQLRIKKKIVKNRFIDGQMQKQTVILRQVLVGRHRSFDTRIGKFGEWAAETQPIWPKEKQGQTKNNIDQKTHYYLPFRFYHQDYKPEKPGDWHWEPVYVAIADKEFYRLDLLWEKEEIVITVTPLNPNSPEIPEHIRPPAKAIQKETASVIRRAR